MSTNSTLTDLANFVGRNERKAAGGLPDRNAFWRAYRNASETARKRGPAHRVTDLLGMVMALSARTRRVVAPRAFIELDVFSPDGRRAVRLSMGNNGER